MSAWAPKRFWTTVSLRPSAGGVLVMLDARAAKTPARAELVLPTAALAERVAAEWRNQDTRIDPASMPFTVSANAAIDKVGPAMAEVARQIAAYAETDLLCYRATQPAELSARQAAAWDPLIDWAATCFGARLSVTQGVIHVAQPAAAVATLTRDLAAMSAFELTGFYDLVALSGSYVIALAVVAGQIGPEQAWQVSRIDEDWQAEIWGADEEAAENARRRCRAFLHAAEFLSLSRRG